VSKMSILILIVASVGILAGAGLGIFVVITVGIRRGDRSHLANAPKSSSEAFAWRLLVGVRYPSEDSEGGDQ
jgi:hypothetical protein